MTSTSFNPIQLQQTTMQSQQPLSLKQGQVFHGTIKKLYPDQMAEIQVGNQKLFAKLETPLKAGDSHFFQVTTINPQAEIKVVSGPMQPTQPMLTQINQLMESMNLPKSAEMQTLLAHFIKNQLPITKETLIQAENLLKSMPKEFQTQEAAVAIQKMVEAKMPFTKEVFHGLLYGAKTNGIAGEISNLTKLIMNDSTILSEAKTNLVQTLQSIIKPFQHEVGGAILSKSIQSIMNQNETIPNRLEALNLLKESNILPQNATLSNWMSLSFAKVSSSTNPGFSSPALNAVVQNIAATNVEELPRMLQQLKTLVDEDSVLSEQQKQQILQLVNRFEALPKTEATITLFAKQFHEQLIKAFSEQGTKMFEVDQQGYSKKDQLLYLLKPEAITSLNATHVNIAKNADNSTVPFIQNLVSQADGQVQAAIDSKAMEHAIKTVLRSLGLSYEATFHSKADNIQENIQSLKPQLLSLLQDMNTPSTVREGAEHILSRLNGMQLHSGENGVQHQLVMQIPLHFFGKNTDATVQWNGRMKENGKIDSNYARILFYLDMENLNETMIDMQVQNRIVTINVYNEHNNLEILANPLKQTLKDGLLEKDYQLSGLFFKQFERDIPQTVIAKSKHNQDQNKKSGVDFRI
ncbi:hypothetical protein [Lysinibacillus sp. BW-2-10]|uniref:hypothetical protein n=1 Tax=Lysinibacillus sp. BW-2-10 TaxID=2590030 RepID=UPI00117E0F27|nr:hypothetical protein [Lysinibacillus sp. BW-2-10]TSI11425.1 hypothetical protein FJQ64_01155 [Lysinibacillus sp. BW-2-10]